MLYIFDWDGTISDSAAKIIACMRIAAERAGVEPQSDEAVRNIIGLGMPEALATLYPGLDEVTREIIRAEYSNYFRLEDAVPSPFFSGAMETMQTLKSRGCYIGVATGKSRNGLDRVLNKLDMQNFFHVSRCADETMSKPHPQMLNEILQELNMDVSVAVMIGDTEYDMAMAQNIGMKRIAVSYGAHHLDRLKKYQPHMCVDNFNEILAWSFE